MPWVVRLDKLNKDKIYRMSADEVLLDRAGHENSGRIWQLRRVECQLSPCRRESAKGESGLEESVERPGREGNAMRPPRFFQS
jgi:hypothetical protein